jgi:hypothetical protein
VPEATEAADMPHHTLSKSMTFANLDQYQYWHAVLVDAVAAIGEHSPQHWTHGMPVLVLVQIGKGHRLAECSNGLWTTLKISDSLPS